MWAQRSDKVFLTVELPDAKDPKVKLEPEGKLTFSATAGADNQKYELDLQLFDKIDVEVCWKSVSFWRLLFVLSSRNVWCTTSRSLSVVLPAQTLSSFCAGQQDQCGPTTHFHCD